jgi:hypothetical protein
MPKSEYLCKYCHQTFEHEDDDLPPTIDFPHDISEWLKARCENTLLYRVWKTTLRKQKQRS